MVSGTTLAAVLGLLGLTLVLAYLIKLQYIWLTEILDEYANVIQP